MDKHYNIILSLLLVLFLLGFILFFIVQQEQNDIYVLYAGSLIHPMTSDIKIGFENITNYNLIGESKGSIYASNMIIDNIE